MADLPIDPIDPLDYLASSLVFDDPAKACQDFNLTLSWIFWRSTVILGHEGGNFALVRHLRYLLLSSLEKRFSNNSPLRVGSYYYHVEIGFHIDNLGILLFRCNKETGTLKEIIPNGAHIVSRKVVDQDALEKAIQLNIKLDTEKTYQDCPSPFGPADVVLPPNMQLNHTKGVLTIPVFQTYRKIRIIEEQVLPLAQYRLKPMTTPPRRYTPPTDSAVFCEARGVLENFTSITQVAIYIGKVPLIEMSAQEMKRFLYMAAARIQSLDGS